MGDISPKVKGTRDAPKPWALFHLYPAIKRKISKVQAGSICRLKRESISSISLQITPCVRDDTLHEVSMNRTSLSPHNCDGMGSHGQQTDRSSVCLEVCICKRSPSGLVSITKVEDCGHSGIKVPRLTGLAMDVRCCCSLPDGIWLFCLLPFSRGAHSHRPVSQGSSTSLDNGWALKPGEAL